MKRSPELEAVCRRVWSAFADRDVDAIESLTTSSQALRAILSADDEWLSGSDSFPELMARRANEIDLVRVEFDRLEAFENGNTGWAAANVTIFRASEQSTSFRSTHTYVLEAGVWRVAQLHTSVGVSNADVFGYEITKGLAGLISSLDGLSAEAVAVATSSHGTVTLMFTDIEDSTVLSEQLGDRAWTELIGDHFSTVHHVVSRAGGTVVKTLGDGAMMALPSVKEAVEAAIELQRTASATDLRVRIGLHTGDAAHIGGDYVGIAVNKAARVASAADGREILVSSATAEMAGRKNFDMGPERIAELKGLDGTHRLIPIIWAPTNGTQA